VHLGVLSNEKLKPWVNWTTLGPPLLEPLAAKNNAQLIAPPPIAWENLREWQRVRGDIRAKDTLFWMQGSARPELPVHIASMLAGRVRRSAFVVDAWKYLINKVGALSVLQRLEPCFVAFAEGYEELKRRFPQGSFEWLPFGVDTAVFDAVPGDRPIFAYSMGRRYDPLHQAILRYCQAHGLEYRYTQRSGEFSDPAELGRMVGSCQYFVVAPPNLADPARTGGFSPFVMRYLEGLSAGARLLGVLPSSGEYELLLPLDAILQVAPDGSDLPAKLDADRSNPNARIAVENARTLVREHHSWARRAEQIFNRLNNGQPTGFNEIWSQRFTSFKAD
jgi:hypothetical protein